MENNFTASEKCRLGTESLPKQFKLRFKAITIISQDSRWQFLFFNVRLNKIWALELPSTIFGRNRHSSKPKFNRNVLITKLKTEI